MGIIFSYLYNVKFENKHRTNEMDNKKEILHTGSNSVTHIRLAVLRIRYGSELY